MSCRIPQYQTLKLVKAGAIGYNCSYLDRPFSAEYGLSSFDRVGACHRGVAVSVGLYVGLGEVGSSAAPDSRQGYAVGLCEWLGNGN